MVEQTAKNEREVGTLTRPILLPVFFICACLILLIYGGTLATLLLGKTIDTPGFMFWLSIVSLIGGLSMTLLDYLDNFQTKRKQLRKCVIDGQCEASDSRLHITIEKWELILIERCGNLGAAFGTLTHAVIVLFLLPVLLVFRLMGKKLI